jgi:hypothetical protein
MMRLIQAVRSAKNPGQMLMQMSRQNPALQHAMQMANGKTPQQMRQMVQQMAQQRGVNLEQLAQQMGVKLPK